MLKYVRFLHATEDEAFAFTFAPLTHQQLAAAMRSQGYHPDSAGYVSFDQDGTAHVSGESITLALKPDMGDARKLGAIYRSTAQMNPAMPPVALTPSTATAAR